MNGNDRAITAFTMVGHSIVHVYELSIPVLVTVWLAEFSVTTATLGSLVAVGYGLFGAGALPGGILADRFGSQPLVVACLFGMGGSFLCLGLAPGIAGITVALATWGVAASVYHPAGLSLISNGVRERGSAFAYHGMAGNLGIASGPFVTALLLLVVDWRTAAMVLAVPALLAGVAGLRVDLDETAAVATADGGDSAATDIGSLGDFVAASRGVFTAGFLTVLALVLCNGLYYRGMLTFLPELLGDFLDPLVGVAPGDGVGPVPDGPVAREFDLSRYLYAGLLAVGIGGQYVGGKLTDRIEPERGLVVTLALLVVIALSFVPASETLPTLVFASVALGFVLFAIQPLSQATIANYSPPGRRGLSFGYTYLVIFGLGAFGAAVVGTALTYGSTTTAFVLLAGVDTVALAFALVLVFRTRD